MTQFHTDDYIEFLHRINPENANNYAREQQKCESTFEYASILGTYIAAQLLQTTSETIVRFLMDYSSIVRFPPVDRWVRLSAIPEKRPHESLRLEADLLVMVVRGRREIVQRQVRHCGQLGWRPSSREESGSEWVLLCQW